MSADLSQLIASLSRPLELIPPTVPLDRIPSRGLPEKSKIRGLFFDIYGTLFISSSGDIGEGEDQLTGNGASRSLPAFLESWGIRVPARELKEALRAGIEAWHQRARLQGIKWPEVEVREIWASILPGLRREGLPALREEQIEDFAASYEVLSNPVWPMPGLKEVFHKLSDSGLWLGVVSNAQFYTPELFPAFTGRSLEDWTFRPELMVFSYRTGRAKPDPWLFEEAARGLELLRAQGLDAPKPGECLYLGNDMLKDCWAADQAGFRTAIFAGDKRSLRLREDDPVLEGFKPNLLVSRLEDLLQIIGR